VQSCDVPWIDSDDGKHPESKDKGEPGKSFGSDREPESPKSKDPPATEFPFDESNEIDLGNFAPCTDEKLFTTRLCPGNSFVCSSSWDKSSNS